MSDALDQATEQSERLLELQLAPHLETALSDDEIEQIALSGRDCCECGLPIPIQRLRAYPLAVRCICCQQDHEDNQR
ncbi:hypothetical protein A6046_03305 [[Haemophilus] ducreyi]|uniref:Zinc finger DksA/TraR C4-type domain-containing protein n=2 Tax=Haemophilus ducreyi TaxID=730 RepID=Q7VPG1_HAEDU|nr:TraR/DksA C4-type zinc finger protein [[Haemophilus] ducreyi]AAP95120.1 hypothetical protein HD_0117 [[Haemophilus] ducreyi 35000HP]AKO30294.1 hypothetical protein RY60_00455 [[Haemophilus] ducreyi]AKO31727.1 hypothetical protein RZ57_00460 [[Haemophilus] ducreyi]AKO33180.1 hypothetical protein RZ58_00460 [[Haemophilus] ducreyi]AKO34629.1 hypothetical protein RZ59_00455 [[Haemophilus] ducreyi]